MAGVIQPGNAMVMQVFRVRVDDAGERHRGDADDRIFAQQGIYIP